MLIKALVKRQNIYLHTKHMHSLFLKKELNIDTHKDEHIVYIRMIDGGAAPVHVAHSEEDGLKALEELVEKLNKDRS